MSNGEVQYDGGSAAPPGRSAKRPDGGGGEATLRLDQEDISRQDTSGYRIIMRDYGEGLAEIGWSFVFSLVPKKSGRGLSEDREAHEDRAMRRARSRLRQLVLSANADYLLTLTYRANVADFRQANADLGRFTRLSQDAPAHLGLYCCP